MSHLLASRHTLTLARIALILGLNALTALGAHEAHGRAAPQPGPMLPASILCDGSVRPVACDGSVRPALSR